MSFITGFIDLSFLNMGFFETLLYGVGGVFLYSIAKEYYWFHRKLKFERKFLKDYDELFKE